MKLKCVAHERRVQVLASTKVVHRQDGSDCLGGSPFLQAGKRKDLTAPYIWKRNRNGRKIVRKGLKLINGAV
jgi:hypothetical protein